MSSFLSDISPSCPSNANLARYDGTSGCLGGGGGGGGTLIREGALIRGGALSFPADDDVAGGCRMADPPGRGCGVGFNLDVACGFFCMENFRSKGLTGVTNDLHQARQPSKVSHA